jgi:hypothetical protein
MSVPIAVVPARSHDRLAIVLSVGAVLAIVATVLIAATGGLSTAFGPVRLTARDPFRVYYLAVLLGSAALWRLDRDAVDGRWSTLVTAAPWLVAAISVMSALVAVRYGAFVAGGADAYGYVTEAMLWVKGSLHVTEPLARVVPSLGAAVAPVGYRLAANGMDLVPIYPPGLPLAMAAAIKLAGFSGAFFVVPLFAAVAVAATYIVGASLGGRPTGVMAAALVACSPIFLLSSMQPMSDVPAAALWLAAIAATTIAPTRWSALVSGLLVSAAVLVRPNLVPLAVIVALFVVGSAPRIGALVLFAAAAILGPIAIALINAHLYGSPVASGYGANASLFSIGSIGANLRRYPIWLVDLQTVFVLLGLIAAALPISGKNRGAAAGLLLFFAVLLACYLPYIPFDSWAFLRFRRERVGGAFRDRSCGIPKRELSGMETGICSALASL